MASSRGSGWNSASGFDFAPNTNVNDPNGMPSDTAAMARAKAKKVMEALDSGEPGAADDMMGKREPKGTGGLIPLDYFKTKFSGKKEKKTSEKVGR